MFDPLPPTELHALLDAVLELNRLGDMAAFRARVVDSLSKLIAAEGVLFATIVSPRHSARDVEARGIDSVTIERAIRMANELAQ